MMLYNNSYINTDIIIPPLYYKTLVDNILCSDPRA